MGKLCKDCGAPQGHHSWCVQYGVGDRIASDPTPVWQKPSLAGSYNVISSPAHYARFAIQPIDFIEANGLDFLQASVLKYLVRFPYKNGVEDLHKARDMLNRLIAREEAKLVGDAGQEVGGHPSAEYTEGRADRGGGTQ